MTDNQKKTEILHLIDHGYQLKSHYTNERDVKLINELINDGYVYEVASNYLLTSEGKRIIMLYQTLDAYEKSLDFTLDIRPTIIPPTQPKKTQIKTIHNGISIKRMFRSDIMLYIIYPLFVLLIGTILLKIFKVIN